MDGPSQFRSRGTRDSFTELRRSDPSSVLSEMVRVSTGLASTRTSAWRGSSRAFHPASLSIPSKGGSASAGVPANSAMEPSRHVARHDQVPAARRFHPRERGRHGKVHTPALQTGVFGHGGRIPHRRLEGGGLPIPEPSSEAEVVEIGPPNSRGVTRTPVASRRGVAGAPRR